MIDHEISPVTFSVTKFCSSTIALFIKLPLETVLRRGQAAVISSPEYVRALDVGGDSAAAAKGKRVGGEVLETIVPLGKFDGVFGTMQTIVKEEGTRAAVPSTKNNKKGKPKVAEAVFRRGQGVEGLWRGWKVSWWGLVGLWTAGVIGGGGDGEF
jgi:fusion and transport protein UGO1